MRFKHALLFALLAMLLTFFILALASGIFTGCSFEREPMLETIKEMIDVYEKEIDPNNELFNEGKEVKLHE